LPPPHGNCLHPVQTTGTAHARASSAASGLVDSLSLQPNSKVYEEHTVEIHPGKGPLGPAADSHRTA
jgi:hypothetical protein